MKRKEATHSEDPMYGATSSSTSLYVARGKGNKYERGEERQEGNDYEVFLSFRGEDTCKAFTDHLYASLIDAGIYVFRDDNEFHVGEEIGPELLRIITQSEISIPIISENYASSKWCLCELAQMLKCKRSRGQIVLPIFYKVEPSQMQHLMGRFGDAINAHKRNLDEMVVKEWEEALKEVMVVKEWEEALKEVSNLKGWESEKIDDRHEGVIIKMVVRKVLGKLKRSFLLNVPKQLVGIDDHVERIMSLIDAKFNDTHIVGICGISGIGKTTLAEVLYNMLCSRFEYCSFVANIQETLLREGIVCLQEKLITDIIGTPCDVFDVDDGINVIQSLFKQKKVLILLDDVDDNTQLNALCGDTSWFKAGSLVIITTRDQSVLNKVRVGYMYQLRELSMDHSLMLFSRHAFQKDHPYSDFEVISRDIVLIIAGLPLTLEVIGSFLRGKSKEVWIDTLNKLKKVPHKKVQETLRIIYEALDDKVKQIFLDIACFFVGSSKQYPTYMWDACGFSPEKGIEELSCMSLIKFDKDGQLMMHDLLRDLGREIVRLEYPRESQKRSTLWIPEKAIDVLDNDKSMEKMKDEARQRVADMETSDRNYAIAAAQNVVGIDDRVKKITDLLEMEVNDEVRIIRICGTDGIGKTTLAKAVYDRISSCFDSSSFLAEVEENTQNPHGILFLQTKLIHDILERDREDSSFNETIEYFLDIFHEMKVLIVVDDVEKQSHLHAIVGDQLQWFGLGSRIIVTSENEEILKKYDPEKTRTYMVSELDDGQAFELFCKHAFRMQSSMPDYNGLANCIVNVTEKLPLAVEVVGSFLRGKSIQEWEKMEKSMKLLTMSCQKTTVGLEEILDICYKELDQQQKHVFLDIACFISGVDARIATYMWPNCYLPSSDCILMPLAKIGENNELQMHRLLRCLGKRILNQEGSGDPIGRKFYIQDMVPKEISGEKGMETAEALCFDFTAGDFQSMPDLRFLKLANAKLSGDFAGVFPNLRWLCWQRCPLDFDAFNFVLRELVILDLSWSKVTEDWGGWRIIKMEKLKVLKLTGCSDLLITPDFSGYKDLEILILEQCSRLVKLDRSIGHLKHLVSLNLKFCSQLNRLPVELGHMTALEELSIDGTSVREIPISIGNLKQLKILSGFKCFPLTHLPSSITYLAALSVLSLDGARISELPSSLGELSNLRRLSLRDCHYMQELPDSIGKMGSSLEELDISATSISKLPNSMRNLQNLRVLRMDSSFIRAFPLEIGNLTKLEELHASWCRSLKGAIPRDIKRLHHLRSLTLGHSGISSLPSEISTISSLQTLDLVQCNEIEVLPELPSSLICLRVSSKRMKAIPLLKDLKKLEELCLSDEDPRERQPPSRRLMPESKVKRLSIWFSRLWNLEFLQTPSIEDHSFSISFPKLRKLELSLSRIIKLEFVYEPPDVPQLKTLTLSSLSLEEVSELPKTLSVLSFRGCSSLKRLPIFQCLTNVSAFELHDSAIEEIEGLEGLKSL